MTSKHLITVISDRAKPLTNLLLRRPVLATFQVTLCCNSACGYCDLPLNQGRYELSREEIRAVFERLYADGIRCVLLQGGEPLLRPDLVDVLEDLTSLGLHVSVITNGTRLTKDLVARFAALRLPLSISLDTLDRARYRLIRGADQLPQVLSGLDLLDGYAFPKFLTCIVSEVNRNDVPEVVRFARSRGFIPVVGAYHWKVGLYGKEDLGLMYDRSAAVRVFEQLLHEDLIPAGYFRQFVKDSVVWLSGQRLEPCDAGRIALRSMHQAIWRLAWPSRRWEISVRPPIRRSSVGSIGLRFKLAPIAPPAIGLMDGWWGRCFGIRSRPGERRCRSKGRA